MTIYTIEFNYRIFKDFVIPIDYTGVEITISVDEPFNNALEFDWKKVVQVLYPDYTLIMITNVTISKVLEEQQA